MCKIITFSANAIFLYFIISLACVYSDDAESKSRISHIISDTMQSLKGIIMDIPIIRDFKFSALETKDKSLMCTRCDTVVAMVLRMIENGTSRDEIAESIVTVCTTLGVETEKVCKGIVDLNLDMLLYIIKKRKLTMCDICQTILEPYECCNGGPVVTWSIPMEKYVSKPELCFQPDIPAQSERKRKRNKIIQITDTHWDENYMPGAKTDCDEPICCRNYQGYGETPDNSAGTFGAYENCDIPLITLNYTLQQIHKQHGHEIVHIIMNGDFIPHNVWDTTRSQVENNIRTQTSLIRSWFPDIAVYFTPGNHDGNPTNLYPTTNSYANEFQWMYDLYAEQWSFSVDEAAKQDMKRAGYYTYVTPDGLRIISLNSMFCYVLNWFLLDNPIDPSDQLQWLADTLYEAEKQNQMVHMIFHIPLGSTDCLSEYSREIWRIIERFSCNIKGIFVGHTHADQFNVGYSAEDINKPIMVVHNGGSITNFINANTNYKVYEIDLHTWDIIDAESWVFDLNESQLKPKWFRLYKFTDEYDVHSLRPESIDKLVHKMAADKKYMDKYIKNYAKGADTALVKDCTTECMQDRLCEIVTINYADKMKCTQIRDEMTY